MKNHNNHNEEKPKPYYKPDNVDKEDKTMDIIFGVLIFICIIGFVWIFSID